MLPLEGAAEAGFIFAPEVLTLRSAAGSVRGAAPGVRTLSSAPDDFGCALALLLMFLVRGGCSCRGTTMTLITGFGAGADRGITRKGARLTVLVATFVFVPPPPLPPASPAHAASTPLFISQKSIDDLLVVADTLLALLLFAASVVEEVSALFFTMVSGECDGSACCGVALAGVGFLDEVLVAALFDGRCEDETDDEEDPPSATALLLDVNTRLLVPDGKADDRARGPDCVPYKRAELGGRCGLLEFPPGR
eukprot:CAMPEP_0179009092 /NCGR_PEP_ID=MMETSP0795-20121207/16086_1 /TAXON_ID=88552 /ORGANISM="Amoebophrya sp., Strain Ameob2" /LENGTH=250 /DNA_ID=CAMNT_0020704263 /DNA_START=871 /DNA_END=1624 /DNA_ORIENTATION=+